MDSLSSEVRSLEAIFQSGNRLEHFAIIDEDNHKGRISTMPLTPFVYNYFIYNNLYSINWEKSLKNGHVVRYPAKAKRKNKLTKVQKEESKTEPQKQKKFEGFLMDLAKENPDALYDRFLPLADMPLEGNWTKIDENDNVTLLQGDEFFKTDLPRLQELVKTHEQQLDQVFQQIEKCRGFVYAVRCDIFHGSSRLGEANSYLKQRVEVYHCFLKCLLSSFFGLASDHALDTRIDDARTGNMRTSSTP